MPSLAELARAVGKRGTLTTAEGLQIEVDILDIRQAYGRVEYLVSPAAGKGQAWVTVAIGAHLEIGQGIGPVNPGGAIGLS